MALMEPMTLTVQLRKQNYVERETHYGAQAVSKAAFYVAKMPGTTLEDLETLWALEDRIEDQYRDVVRSTFGNNS